MLGIRHLALRVRDIQRAMDFYAGVLGMTVDWQPDDLNVYLTSGSDNLALHGCERVERQAPEPGPGLDHFGFLVATPEEVDEWALYLAARGVSLLQPPKTHRDGSRSIYFSDPDGNVIQLLFLARTSGA